MPLATKKPRDIVWICIDSLRVDCLRTGGNAQARPNFFDRLFKESVFFSRCLATGQGTLASAFSFFTSLLPSVTGVVSQTANCIVQADPRAVTVTDILRHHGYSTWRYDDMGTYSCQPKSGFDHFEGGYFNLQDTPGLSFDAPRRNAFLARVNQATSPFFLYLHLDYLHEFGGESSPVWSRDRYCELVAAVSREVRDLLGKIARINEAILLVNTDHGVTLDEDWARFEKLHGGNLSEARVRAFAAFRAPGLAPRRIDATISSLDLAPTLLDLVGLPDMKAQGRSLVETMASGVLAPQPAVSQWAAQPQHQHLIGGACPGTIDSIRCSTDAWTVVREGSGEAVVIDPNGEPPGSKAEAEALACLDAVENGPDNPDAVYEARGQALRKRNFSPSVSVLLPVTAADENLRHLRPCLLSLMDQIPLTEILVLDFDATGRAAAAVKEFDDHPFLRRLDVVGQPGDQALDLGLAAARAPYLALASAQYRYTENYLQESLKALRADSQAGLATCNLYQVIRDSRQDYLYLGPDSFYVSHSLWSGGSGSVRNLAPYATGESGEGPPLGECAVFTRQAALEAGGFLPGKNPAAEAIGRMTGMTKRIHLRRPMIVTPGLVACPSLGLAEPQEARPGLSALVPLCGDDALIKSLPLLLRSLADVASDLAEVLVLAPRALSGAASAMLADRAGQGCPARLVCADEPDHNLFNRALREARGDYLAWTRPGELFAPGSLARLVARLRENPTLGMACSDLAGDSDGALAAYRDLWLGARGLTGVVYRSRLHLEAGGFTALPNLAGEWDMLLRLAEVGSMEAVPEAMVFPPRGRGPRPEVPRGALRCVLDRAAWRMNDCIDLMRLYPEVFTETGASQGVELVREHFGWLLQRNHDISALGKEFSVIGPEKYFSPAWKADEREYRQRVVSPFNNVLAPPGRGK